MSKNTLCKDISFACMVMVAIVMIASNVQAGTQVLTFDTNNWGTGTMGTYNTIKNFEASGGNPGACLLLKGIGGVGGSFVNEGFTGDFAAGGFGQIAFDIKVKHWFPNPSQPPPVAYVFVRRGIGYQPWCKEIQGFAPVTTVWNRYSVDFNPDWNDTEAQAHGWNIINFPGPSMQTASFKETLHNVYQTGMWIRVIDGGAECHIFLDNYSLLPASGSKTVAPIRPIPKSRIKGTLRDPSIFKRNE